MYGMERNRYFEKSGQTEDTDRPKVLTRGTEELIYQGASAIHRNMEAYRDELADRGIQDSAVVENMVSKYEYQQVQEFARDMKGLEFSEKNLFGFNTAEIQETDSEIRERLQECGVQNIHLEGVRERYQELIAESAEQMCESYPELKGYIGTIRSADLPQGVFACAGPIMTESGFQTEIQVNQEIFGKKGLENRLERLEMPNWKGESWLAGEGCEAILKHEMAHLLHLRMIAKKQGLEIGDTDEQKFKEVQKLYIRNDIAAGICYETMKEQNVHPNDYARNISVYGAHDMGECFAEAISEYETRKNPRPFAVAVHEKYENFLHTLNISEE